MGKCDDKAGCGTTLMALVAFWLGVYGCNDIDKMRREINDIKVEMTQKGQANYLRIENVIGGPEPERFYEVDGKRYFVEVDGKQVESYFPKK